MKKALLFFIALQVYAAVSSACDDTNICVGDLVYCLGHDNPSRIVGINKSQGSLTVRNTNTLNKKVVFLYEIAITKGCTKNLEICVGDTVMKTDHEYQSQVVGIFPDNAFYIRNSNTGTTFRVTLDQVAQCKKINGQKICVWK